MATYEPRTIEQIGEDLEISWNQTNQNLWITSQPLIHISNPATGDIRTKSYSLICTNLQIQPIDPVQGISVFVKSKRNGRVTDETVQLTYQGQPIGDNQVSYESDENGKFQIKDDNTYGGENDTWGVEITPEMLQDPSFGVILKFSSHPYFPHKDQMILYGVSLTVF